jgi:shikimate kinase
MRYFIIGFMGSGKTYWGKQWSEVSKLPFFDLDEEIEKKEGKSIAAIFAEKGEAAFRKMETDMLASFFEKDGFILSCGGGTPCFHKNMKRMNEEGVTIYLESTVEELVQRLHVEKETRPLIAGMNDEVLSEFISHKLSERTPFYHLAMYHLPTRFMSNDNFQKILRRHG